MPKSAATHDPIDVKDQNRSQRESRDSEKQLWAILDNTPSVIYLKDVEGRYILVNRRYEELFHISRSQIVGMTDYDLFPEEVADVLRENDRQVIQSGTAIQTEELVPHDDDVHTYISTKFPLRDSGGGIYAVCGISTDISERKQAEEQQEQLVHQMGERVKELTCMYSVAQSIRSRDTIAEILEDIVALIPPGWHYPEITCARIRHNDAEFLSEPFQETIWSLTSDIVVYGERRGTVEVYYLEERPTLDEGPFLKEERNLIDGISRTLAEAIERKLVEQAFKESEIRHRTLFEGSAQGILIADVETMEFRYANPASCRMFGCTNEELQGMSLADIIVKEGLQHAISEFEAQARGERSFAPGIPCVRKDGVTFYADVNSASGLQIDGRQCIAGFFTDVTERKKAEEAEREAAERLNAITQSTHNAIIMMDHNGAITFWNPAAERMFGYSETEANGKEVHSLLMSEEYREVFEKGFKQFRDTGTGSAVGKTVQLESVRRDGSRFPISLSISAMRVQHQWHAVGIVQDITEQQQREQQFQHDVSRYMAMIDTVPAMVYLKDVDHRYMVANRAFCDKVGKPLNELVGKTDYDIFPRDTADSYHLSDKAVMDEDRGNTDQERKIKDAEGVTRWIATTKVPLHDRQGLVTGVVGLVQDVTDYHMSREQLVQADKLAAIGTLAAGVAHEINNPIGFISSNLNTMAKYLTKIQRFVEKATPGENEDKEGVLDILTDFVDAVSESTEGTTRVKNIVVDLKSFSRVDRAEKEHANLNEGLESTLNMVWNELKYHCTVEKDLGDIPELYCIPNQLNQVFMNMLVNAGQATKDTKGRIRIRTWANDRNINVSIRDNGTGIPADKVGKIFEPFFTTKDPGSGTGLGLSLAYDIVKKHGGSINVNTDVGVGTEFVISLPLEGISDD